MVDVLAELRHRVLAEAKTWLSTPYHHQGRVKGAGADCLTFIAEVYERAGVIDHVEIPFYRQDFMRHRGDELYLAGVLARGHEVEAPEPADIVLYRVGRVFAHSGIVVDWPQIIHAHAKYGVLQADGMQGYLMPLERRFFSPF